MKQQLQNKYNKIKFNSENHAYYVGDKPLISVTTLIKKYTPPFDTTGEITARCALKNGITPREQALLWEAKGKEATNKGTETHLICEKLLRGLPFYCLSSTPEFEAKIRLLQSLCEEFKPHMVACEQIIYNKELGVAGTIDLITLNQQDLIGQEKEKKLDLWDWKTNSKDIIIDEYYETMTEPLNNLPANNYYKYALQLSIYRYLLELDGFRIGETNLIHIKNENITIIPMPYLRIEAEMIINEYKQQS